MKIFLFVSCLPFLVINAESERLYRSLIACQRVCLPPDNGCRPAQGALYGWECVADCQAAPVPANGMVETNDGTMYESIATYSCNEGYVLSGTETRTCLSTSVWSAETPTCEPVDCGAPDTPTNGQSSDNGTTLNSVVQYSCSTGYILVGPESRTCLANGTWSGGMTPCCLPVMCPELSTPSNGTLSLSDYLNFGSVATYTCDACFEAITGNMTRECAADGTWTGTEPTCSLKVAGYEYSMGSSCYQFNPGTTETWEDALTLCNNSGAHLVEINSAAEDCFVLSTIQSLGATDNYWWIGGTDLDLYSTEGTFVWQSTGSPIGPYLNWKNGEPEDVTSQEEDCMALIMIQYQWVDRRCTVANAYACELE